MNRPSRSSTGSPSSSASTSTVRPGVLHARSADEDAAQRRRVPFEREIGLEARCLPAVRVPRHLDVHEPEVVAVEDDHPRAGAEHRARELGDRRVEPVEAHEPHERRRLPAGDDEAIHAFQVCGLTHLDDVRAQPPQHLRVLAEIALHREDADPHATKCMDGCAVLGTGWTSCSRTPARDASAGPS